MASLAIPTLLALTLAGQGAVPRDARPQPQTGTGAIHGRIVAGDTGRPLPRARVRLTAPELGPDGLSTSTNADGRYEINDLPAARYTLTVTRSGYLSLRYGQRRPLEQGKPLELLDKQALDHIDFSLPRMSQISGRITDEAGEPIAGAIVFVLRSMYESGRRQLVPTGSSSTDDSGQYRVLGLAPGTYVVMASIREMWTVNENGHDDTMAYATTYFPGTTNAAGARRVTVGIGQEAINTDFGLIPGRAANISGTAFDSHGQPLGFVAPTQVMGNMVGSFGGGVPVAADGTFTLRNVPPGDYTLRSASAPNRGADSQVASLPIAVDGVDLENVALVASPGWSITGRLTTDTGTAPSLPRDRISVGARPLESSGTIFIVGGPEYNQALKADWTFAVTGLTDAVRLRVALPPGWIVKAALHDGRDIADAPIEVKAGGSLTGVQLIVTDRVAGATGRVVDDNGAPLADGTVIVFSADSEKWFENSRFVRTARPDQNGRFQMTDVPPGEYLALAVDYVEDGAWDDPDYLDALRQYAQTITLAAGSSQVLSLKMVTLTR